MKLKPAAGRAVRDPAKGTLLPAEGAEVELDAFWRRRLRDGDVEMISLDQTGTGESKTAVTTTTANTTTANTTTAANTKKTSTEATS